MFLHIADQMTVEEVQDRFHDCFPNLEIVFYATPFRNKLPYENALKLHRSERIEFVRQYRYNGALEIKSWFPIAKVERDLKELFDLNAHILRVSENGVLIEPGQEDALLWEKNKIFPQAIRNYNSRDFYKSRKQ